MSASIDPEEQKRRVAESFDANAASYDRVHFTERVAHRLVAHAAIRPGEAVLDLATGTGWAALAAAQRAGPAGRVVGVDLTPAMLARARAKAAAAGLPTATFLEGDAERPALPAESFDVVLCASGLFFLPDMAGALRAWRRLARPGGRVAVSGFGATFRRPWQALFAARAAAYGLPAAPDVAARLSDPDACRALLRAAGWEDAAVRSEQLGFHYRDVDEYWADRRNMGPLWRLAPADLARFRAEHLAEVGALATADGIWFDLPVHFALGRKAAP